MIAKDNKTRPTLHLAWQLTEKQRFTIYVPYFKQVREVVV
jgi:hypothetical protein